MTIKFNNVFVEGASTVAGLIEKEGPLRKYFDKTYDDYYFNESSLELAEVKLQNDSIDILLKKIKRKKDIIDLVIGGDLLNQITATCYAVKKYKTSFLGVYSACATTMESIIIGGTFIESGKINNCICTTSSHNLTSEKQYRNPIEYGAPKPKTATFTSTGGASIYLTSKETNVKVTSGTIGTIVDLNWKDPNNMGAAMAPAAADTIYNHLKNNDEKVEDYDLILTGDLGLFGKEILKEYINKQYKLKLDTNYNDCGVMLYDMEKQKEITAGGSGPVCSALVNYSYVYKMLKEGTFKKVMLVSTGALFSPTFSYQKQSILGIAHAVTLEANV